MFHLQQKFTKHTKTQFEETEHASASDSDMTDMLKLSYQEFKTTTITMLKILTGKVDNM